jgi:hypothetical protein
MMPKFHPDHAVEIVAPEYGSAYRIGGRLVLTCKHLFDDDNRCKVRFRTPSNYSDKQDIDAEVIWKAPGHIDIALVELPKTIKVCDPVSFGQLPEVNSAERVEFDFFGWPSWGFVNSEDGNKATGLHIDGIIYLADRSASGLLTLEANRTPSELEVEQCNKQGKSPWQGASGAAIVCNGLVVGVQKWHQNSDRPKSLEAESLARIYDNQKWCEILEKHDIDPNPITTGLSPENETRLSSRDPLSQIWDYVPTGFELLGQDFYKKRYGNTMILSVYSANWSLITQGNYIERDQQATALNLAKSLKDYQGISFCLIRGNPGEGKTALMKWLGYQLRKQHEIVLQKETKDRFNWLKLLSDFSQQIQQRPIFLIADDLFREDKGFLEALEENELQFPLIIIGTTRWNENQQELLEYQGYRIEDLDLKLSSVEERERILRQIRQADQGVNERLNRLSSNELTQLMNAPTMLTLMLQLSEGKPFDRIIADAIKKLPNEPHYPVYQVFGVICAFYQYDIAVYPNILALCLPKYSQDAIDDVVNSALDTDLKGLVQIGYYAGYEGLTAIHQVIAKHAITVPYKYKRRNKQENLGYSSNLLEKYLREIIPNLEEESETHQRWFCRQLRDLTSNNQQNLVRRILEDFFEKMAILQQKSGIRNLIAWKDIYRNIDLLEKSENFFDLLLSVKPEDGYEFQYKFFLMKKRGKAKPIREIIIEFQTWLESNPNDIHVRQGYLALIASHGNFKQKEDAITETSSWLGEENHRNDIHVRQGYLALIASHGNFKQKEDAITETSSWLGEENHRNDVYIRNAYLALVASHRNSKQKEDAITETSSWLGEKDHRNDVHVRNAYLALVASHGNSKQKEDAITETSSWLGEENHRNDVHIRQGYLALIASHGNFKQKEDAITETSSWLGEEAHRNDVHIRNAYLALVAKHGNSEQKEDAITETSRWLGEKDHRDDVHIRQGYLSLVGRKGTPEQREQAITQTNTWLESHLSDVHVRQGYLALVGSNGTFEQKQQAIVQTSNWLESNPNIESNPNNRVITA